MLFVGGHPNSKSSQTGCVIFFAHHFKLQFVGNGDTVAELKHGILGLAHPTLD